MGPMMARLHLWSDEYFAEELPNSATVGQVRLNSHPGAGPVEELVG